MSSSIRRGSYDYVTYASDDSPPASAAIAAAGAEPSFNPQNPYDPLFHKICCRIKDNYKLMLGDCGIDHISLPDSEFEDILESEFKVSINDIYTVMTTVFDTYKKLLNYTVPFPLFEEKEFQIRRLFEFLMINNPNQILLYSFCKTLFAISRDELPTEQAFDAFYSEVVSSVSRKVLGNVHSDLNRWIRAEVKLALCFDVEPWYRRDTNPSILHLPPVEDLKSVHNLSHYISIKARISWPFVKIQQEHVKSLILKEFGPSYIIDGKLNIPLIIKDSIAKNKRLAQECVAFSSKIGRWVEWIEERVPSSELIMCQVRFVARNFAYHRDVLLQLDLLPVENVIVKLIKQINVDLPSDKKIIKEILSQALLGIPSINLSSEDRAMLKEYFHEITALMPELLKYIQSSPDAVAVLINLWVDNQKLIDVWDLDEPLESILTSKEKSAQEIVEMNQLWRVLDPTVPLFPLVEREPPPKMVSFIEHLVIQMCDRYKELPSEELMMYMKQQFETELPNIPFDQHIVERVIFDIRKQEAIALSKLFE